MMEWSSTKMGNNATQMMLTSNMSHLKNTKSIVCSGKGDGSLGNISHTGSIE